MPPLTATRVKLKSKRRGVGSLGWLQVATSPGAYSQEKFNISANAGVTDRAAATAAARILTRMDMNGLPLVLSLASPGSVT